MFLDFYPRSNQFMYDAVTAYSVSEAGAPTQAQPRTFVEHITHTAGANESECFSALNVASPIAL